MPQNSKNSHRAEASVSKLVKQSKSTSGPQQVSDMNGAQTEEEKIAAMFQTSKNQWDVQQQEMAK
jgi:protein MPE1